MYGRAAWLCAVYVALATLFLTLPGDQSEAGDESPARSLCWRGRPLPECHKFLITELSVYARLDPDPTHASDTPLHLTLDLGVMRNTAPRRAWGATVYLAGGTDHARVGARFRHRTWLTRSVSLDIAPGIIAYGSEDGAYTHQFPGLVGGVSLVLGDLIGVGLEVEHARYELAPEVSILPPRVSDTTWRAGGKLGSGAGVFGTLLVVGFFTLVIISTGG